MQATVAEFDPVTRSGAVLSDDGHRWGFDAAAFEASGLRLLRPGQRVHVETDDAGRPVLVTLLTMRGRRP